jgi:hypothetical protein
MNKRSSLDLVLDEILKRERVHRSRIVDPELPLD